MITDDPKHPGIDQAGPGGQNLAYLVMSEAERAKGFKRPFRNAYRHVGKKPKHPLRRLTPEEDARHAPHNYVAFEAYPPEALPCTGRYWTQSELDSVTCGTVTTMADALSETYARDPRFYGSTYCCACGTHFPVDQFVWERDNQVVGS